MILMTNWGLDMGLRGDRTIFHVSFHPLSGALAAGKQVLAEWKKTCVTETWHTQQVDGRDQQSVVATTECWATHFARRNLATNAGAAVLPSSCGCNW